jgi:hypothetical protein
MAALSNGCSNCAAKATSAGRVPVDQLAGEMDPSRQRDSDGGSANVLGEEPAQVPRPDAETGRQRLDAVLIERAFHDQPDTA